MVGVLKGRDAVICMALDRGDELKECVFCYFEYGFIGIGGAQQWPT
jgi:hypothetical protein